MTRRLINQDRDRENRQQVRLIGIVQRKMAAALRREIRSASLAMITGYTRTGALGPLPDDHMLNITLIYTKFAAITVELFGNRVLGRGKSMGLLRETKGFSEFFQEVALQFIAREAVRARITSVSSTTRRHIIAEIMRGEADGAGLDEIARGLVDNVGSISRLRAITIARTETHAAANAGADQAAKATGLRLRKEWVAVNDHRTRDFGEGDGIVDAFSHRAMDGQIVDMDMTFSVPNRLGGREAMLYPGDPAGSPGNTINCRCSVSHVVVE